MQTTVVSPLLPNPEMSPNPILPGRLSSLDAYRGFVIGAAVMFAVWLILYYMYRHKIFLKI
jgi:predicted acyltransferase